MKFISHVGAGLFAFALIVGPASAADVPVGPIYKAAPAGFNWSGTYIGIQGGWGLVDTRITDAGLATTGDFDGSGAFGGLTLGRNWQAFGSPWVWGLELDGSLSNIDALSTVNCGAGCGTDLRAFGTFRGRLGYAQGATLFFVTAGGAVGSFEQIVQGVGISETLWGWTAGAGVEVAFGSRWSGKIEYLFIGFEDGFHPNGPVAVSPLDVQLIRLGLNYRF